MTSRYFIDRTVSRWEEGEAVLCGDEAHHFTKVMRGKAGDSLVLFDGTGKFAHGIAELINKDGIQIRITDTFSDDIESPIRLTIASALPKGDRQRFFIEKLAELGVARYVPVQMTRSVARANDSTLGRFRRYVIESSKQCGRNVLMEVSAEVPMNHLNDWIEKTIDSHSANSPTACEKYLLHPVALGSVGQTTPQQVLMPQVTPPSDADGVSVRTIIILAGPEGSFTEQEIALALQAGFCPLDLGKRILRTETACIAASAVFLCF